MTTTNNTTASAYRSDDCDLVRPNCTCGAPLRGIRGSLVATACGNRTCGACGATFRYILRPARPVTTKVGGAFIHSIDLFPIGA